MELDFTRNKAYVDNRSKAVLDDIALKLQQDPNQIAVLVGCFATGEKSGDSLAELRTAASRTYLTKSKGLDDSRIILHICKTDEPHAAIVAIFTGKSDASFASTLGTGKSFDPHRADEQVAYIASQEPGMAGDKLLQNKIDFTIGTAHFKTPPPLGWIRREMTDERRGLLLSASCDETENNCDQLVMSRLQAASDLLIRTGNIDARRIVTTGKLEDGTPSVLIRVLKSITHDPGFLSPTDIAETLPSAYLSSLLPEYRKTMDHDHYVRVENAFSRCKAVGILIYPDSVSLTGWHQDSLRLRLLAGQMGDGSFESKLQGQQLRGLLPFACLHGEVEDFPQLQQPPAGIRVRRLSSYSVVQNINLSGFEGQNDPLKGLPDNASSVDLVWTLNPQDASDHSIKINFKNGDSIPLDLEVKRTWLYYAYKSWMVIAALSGMGIFGLFARLWKKYESSRRKVVDNV